MARATYRKVITSPKLIEQINPDNKKIVDKFIKNFKTKRSKGSVESYISNYNIFFCWNILYNNNKKFIELKKFEMIDFFDFGVNDLHWSPNRYSQMWSSLNTLSDFVENILDEQYPDFKPVVRKIEKTPKSNVRKKSVFSKEELSALEKWLEEKGLIQEICLLKLIMSSGARVSELVRFTTELIDVNNVVFDGLFLETTDEMTVKGRGVNGKQILRYLIKDLFVPDYERWLVKRNEIMQSTNQTHINVFIKLDGNPASVTTIRSWMEKWDKFFTENYGKPWYAHAGRHFWTTYLKSIGLEDDFIQELQKWSTGDMVKIYNDQTAKDKKWKGLDKLKNHLEAEKQIIEQSNSTNSEG
jgi:integrase